MGKTPSNFIDLTGEKYGRLTVIKRGDNVNGKVHWLCSCDCGNPVLKNINGCNLRRGKVKSCGCLNLENVTKHGLCTTRLYKIFQGMKNRCYNEDNDRYKHYGGRGIIICEEWLINFKSFYDWSIQNGYSDNLSIDRVDNDGNYEPDNCRWATNVEQANNKQYNAIIDFGTNSMTHAQYTQSVGFHPNLLYSRLKRGVKDIKELIIPPKPKVHGKLSLYKDGIFVSDFNTQKELGTYLNLTQSMIWKYLNTDAKNKDGYTIRRIK